MGYASFGDNARAQQMIDFARIRFDGTPGNVAASDIPDTHFSQLFEGGFPPEVALGFNGPNLTGAPFRGGFDFQGWSYGSGEYERIIDYLLMVKTATGEDLFTKNLLVLKTFAQKHALPPPIRSISGDWGGIGRGHHSRLPARLAFLLEGPGRGGRAALRHRGDRRTTYPM